MGELFTRRLILKTLDNSFTEELFLIWKDWDVVKFTYARGINTIDDCKTRIINVIEYGKTHHDIGPYVVMLESEVIGYAGGVLRSEESGEYEIYYHFKKSSWGRGFGTETAKELVKLSFLNEKAIRVSAEAVVENASSWRILEKIGMKREGCLRKKFVNQDGIYDLYVYSILKDEWMGVPLQL